MFKHAYLLLFLALPFALATVTQDEALKAEAREVTTEAGYLYELPESEMNTFLEYTEDHSITFEKMPGFIRKKAIKSYFEDLKRARSDQKRIFYLPAILRGKHKLQTPDLALPLVDIYSNLEVRHGYDRLREFIHAITRTIIGYTIRLNALFDNNSAQVFFALNNPFNKRCKKLADSGMYEDDTKLLYETAKSALEKKPKFAKFILEVVVVGIVEVLRVTPCVLDSTDNYGDWLDQALKTLKAPRERTVFDPLPNILARVEKLKENEDIQRLLDLSDVGDEKNALIRIRRYLDRTTAHDREDELMLIRQFIQSGDFAPDTRLHHIKEKLGPLEL